MTFLDLSSEHITANDVDMETVLVDGNEALRIVLSNPDFVSQEPTVFDEPTYATINNINFHNGTIEVQVMSRLIPGAPAYVRGFIGLAFRISENNTNYESFYIRPTNSRFPLQLRRNRSAQYYAYPDYKFDRLRREEPEMYETYVNLELDKWIDLKIEVKDNTAKFYVNNAEQPTLLVNDLKLGANHQGKIGLWVDVGTEGFFRNLKITCED